MCLDCFFKAPETEVLHKTKLHRTVEAKIKLPILPGDEKITNDVGGGDGLSSSSSVSQINGINALIPLRSSVDPSWKTITLPLKVIHRKCVIMISAFHV